MQKGGIFMYNNLGFADQINRERIGEYIKGQYFDKICVADENIDKNELGITPSVAKKLGLYDGEYVLVTPKADEAPMVPMLCMKISICGNDDLQNSLVAKMNPYIRIEYEKCIQEKGFFVSIFPIKENMVSNAINSFSANKVGVSVDEDDISYEIKGDWIETTSKFEQEVPHEICVPNGCSNYHMVTYKCPVCKENISKVLTKNIHIFGENISETTKVVFACNNCTYLLAPKNGKSILGNPFYTLKLSREDYDGLTKFLDEIAR